MGAGASVGEEGGAAAVEEDESGPVNCTLQEMPEKIEEVVYVAEKWPCVIDMTEQAGRYLRYSALIQPFHCTKPPCYSTTPAQYFTTTPPPAASSYASAATPPQYFITNHLNIPKGTRGVAS